MDYLSRNIALNLRRIRKAKCMSLDVVSEQTGVSKSMLAHIEKGDANPSIGVLRKITSGLHVDFNDLIDTPPKDTMLVNVNSMIPTKEVENQYKVWTCFPIEDNHVVEIYRIDIEPNGVYESRNHGEKTREYISMIEGEVVIQLDKEFYIVKPDDVFRFEADRIHQYINRSDKKVSFIVVFVEYR